MATITNAAVVKGLVVFVSILVVLANVYQVLVVDVTSILQQQQGNQGGGGILPTLMEYTNGKKENKVAGTTTTTNDNTKLVAGLSCPSTDTSLAVNNANDMVYWQNVPSDTTWHSPLYKPNQYVTFEPDEGGWNNIRMSMETCVMIALATGRTLVMPPPQGLYLLDHADKEFGFGDFFHFDRILHEYKDTLRIISFQEFLVEVAMTGQLRSTKSGETGFPPENRTDWRGGKNWHSARGGQGKTLWPWVREHTAPLEWNNQQCVAAFPSERGPAGVERMHELLKQVPIRDKQQFPNKPQHALWSARVESYSGNPTPVDAPPLERLREMLANRQEFCIYDERLQNELVVHIKGEESSGHRMLVHFYAFLFFEDWHTDLWVKRFVRDHLRYLDEIQCAAARVVEAVQVISKSRGGDGGYDSFHIRRGDFQYKEMHMSADVIYENNTKGILKEGATVFIATDEKERSYFEPLKKHYHCLFLNDFKKELADLNPNYYGMVDQLVASRGNIFFGAFLSTFTGYINRIRGYHAQKNKGYGYEHGIIDSYYYTPDHFLKGKRLAMRRYRSVVQGFWQQEFAVAWRDLDHDVAEVKQ